MHCSKIIALFIILFTLTGCELNLEKVRYLQSRVDGLEQENKRLTNQLNSNKEEIASRDEELDNCYGEIEKYKSGFAEKHNFWLKIGFFVIFCIFTFFLIWIKFDFYLTQKKAPKEEEIEKSKNIIENEKSLVEKIRSDGKKERKILDELPLKRAHLVSEITHLEEELAQKKDELSAEISEAQEKLQSVLQKIASAEENLKLLNSFRKK